MTKETYFEMQEQLGEVVVPDDIPLDINDFPYEVQQALHLYSLLPDNYGGMSATWLGKDFSQLPFYFDIYEVKYKRLTLDIMSITQSIKVRSHHVKIEREKELQKAKEAAKKNSLPGGKNISIKG